jgi:photosystem II stability/assembly factor-like uncharacterized protein
MVPLRHANAATGAAAAAPAYRWANVPLGAGAFVNGLSFHPRERGLLYARSDVGGLYRYEPATAQWTPLLDGLGLDDGELMSVLSLALDPDDPERVYAACGARTAQWSRKGALLISTDRGRTWTTRDLDVKLGGQEPGRGTGERLQVDPHLTSVLLLGTTQDGLLRSTDGGKTFQSLSFGPKHVSLVMFDPSSAAPESGCRRMWAGSHDKPGLYVSEDGGRSFNREPGLPEQVPQRAVMARDRSLYVTFAAVDAGKGADRRDRAKADRAQAGSVWRRDRSGQWTDITPVKPVGDNGRFGYSGIDVDPRVPSRVVVATVDRWTPGEEMYLSLDSGQTWTPLTDQSRHNSSPYPWLADQMQRSGRLGWWISDLKIDPFDSAHMIYGTGYGPWETRNLGAAKKDGPLLWEFAAKGMELTSATEIRSPTGGATLLAAMGWVVGGAAWDQIDATPKAGLFAPQGESSNSVDFAEAAPGIIARTCQVYVGGRVSLDGGASWRPFADPPAQPGQEPPRGGRIAVSAKGGFMVWAPGDGRAALCSHDRGKSWEPCAGWPVRESVLVPVADRTVEGVFYVYDFERGRILQSVDGGRRFDPAILRLPVLNQWQGGQLVCAPGTLRDLWLALPDGLAHLPGADQRARTIDNVVEARLVALGKAAPDAAYHTLYVWGRMKVDRAEVTGLFRSTDLGATFTRIDDDEHRYGNLLSISADPLEFGVIYLAAQGRGIVVGRPKGSA